MRVSDGEDLLVLSQRPRQGRLSKEEAGLSRSGLQRVEGSGSRWREPGFRLCSGLRCAGRDEDFGRCEVFSLPGVRAAGGSQGGAEGLAAKIAEAVAGSTQATGDCRVFCSLAICEGLVSAWGLGAALPRSRGRRGRLSRGGQRRPESSSRCPFAELQLLALSGLAGWLLDWAGGLPDDGRSILKEVDRPASVLREQLFPRGCGRLDCDLDPFRQTPM